METKHLPEQANRLFHSTLSKKGTKDFKISTLIQLRARNLVVALPLGLGLKWRMSRRKWDIYS